MRCAPAWFGCVVPIRARGTLLFRTHDSQLVAHYAPIAATLLRSAEPIRRVERWSIRTAERRSGAGERRSCEPAVSGAGVRDYARANQPSRVLISAPAATS